MARGQQGQDRRRDGGACDRRGFTINPDRMQRTAIGMAGFAIGGMARLVLLGHSRRFFVDRGITHGTELAAPGAAGARSGLPCRAPIRIAAGAGQALSPSPTACNDPARAHSYVLHARSAGDTTNRDPRNTAAWRYAGHTIDSWNDVPVRLGAWSDGWNERPRTRPASCTLGGFKCTAWRSKTHNHAHAHRLTHPYPDCWK